MTKETTSSFERQQARIEGAINRRFENDSHPTNTGIITSLSDFIDVVSIDINCEEEDHNIFAAFESPDQRKNAVVDLDRFKVNRAP